MTLSSACWWCNFSFLFLKACPDLKNSKFDVPLADFYVCQTDANFFLLRLPVQHWRGSAEESWHAQDQPVTELQKDSVSLRTLIICITASSFAFFNKLMAPTTIVNKLYYSLAKFWFCFFSNKEIQVLYSTNKIIKMILCVLWKPYVVNAMCIDEL